MTLSSQRLRRIAPALTAGGLLLMAIPAQAGQHFQWNNGSGGTWGTGTNWTYLDTGSPNHIYPQAHYDYAYFTNTGLAGNIAVSDNVTNAMMIDMQFSGSANYTISSSNGTNALTFSEFSVNTNDGYGNGVAYILSGGTGTNTISAPIIVSTADTTAFVIDQQNTTHAFTVSGTITNNGFPVTVQGAGITALTNAITGAGSLTKAGAGQLNLSGANGYTGGTTISGGRVSAGTSNALGSGAVTLAGGTLTGLANTALSTAGSLSLGSGTSFLDFAGLSNLTFTFGSAATFTGTLNVLNYNSGIGDRFFLNGAALTQSQLSSIVFVNPNGNTGNYTANESSNQVVVGSAAAPEPGTLLSLGVGLLGLGGFARRRRA
jgi:fibronectin-binding autotransporter adhesin